MKYQLSISLILVFIISSSAWDLDQMLESGVPDQALGQVQMLQEVQAAPLQNKNDSETNEDNGKNCTLCLIMPIPSVVPDLNNNTSTTKPDPKLKKQALLHASDDRVYLAISANKGKNDDKSGSPKNLDNNGTVHIKTPNGEIKLTYKPSSNDTKLTNNGGGVGGDNNQNTKSESKDKNQRPLDNKKITNGGSDTRQSPNGTKPICNKSKTNGTGTVDDPKTKKPLTSKQSNQTGGEKSDTGNGNQNTSEDDSNSNKSKTNDLKQKPHQGNSKTEKQQKNTINGKDNSTGFIPPKPDLNLSKASLKYEKFTFKKENGKNSTEEENNSTNSDPKKMLSPKSMKTQDLKSDSTSESSKKRNKRSVDEIEFMRIFGTFRKIGFWAWLTIAQNVNVFR